MQPEEGNIVQHRVDAETISWLKKCRCERLTTLSKMHNDIILFIIIPLIEVM